MYKGTIFILKINIMKEMVSNFNIIIENLFKDPQDYTYVVSIEEYNDLKVEQSWNQEGSAIRN